MTYRFGVFEFDAASGSLLRNGRAVSLEPQPAKALARLLAGAGEIVTRDQLREAVWGTDTHVDFDRGLAYCLSRIRGALGDNAENPIFVQTLPKKGYRFIAALSVTADAPIPPRLRVKWVLGFTGLVALASGVWGLMRFPSTAPTIIAVSIFDNETGLPQHDRMVNGLADLVVTRLSQLAPDRVSVIGNATILRQPRNIRNLKAIAKEVRADYVLLGQLQTAEGGLRFVTHFIRLSDLVHLKANRIPLPDGNVAGLETAVVAEFERATKQYLLSPEALGRPRKR
jgi:DNA-binding winged helix-turn-helix (wHTH) protein/TolB-like protein